MKNWLLQKKFIKHNNYHFNFKKNLKNQILVEFNAWAPLQIANSYFLISLQEKYNASIAAYAGFAHHSSPLKRNFLDTAKWYLGSFFSLKNFGVYKSIGCEKFLWPEYSNKKKAFKLYNSQFKKIKNKRDLENLKIHGIWIGDLLYDSYIKSKRKVTIDIRSKDFSEYFFDFIRLFLFWEEYIRLNNVKAIVYSHSVYLLGLPARIAIHKNIKAFVCHAEYVYSCNKKNLFARADFINAKAEINKIDKKILKIGLKNAKKRIDLRLSGKKNIDIWWAKKSSFGKIKKKKVLNNNKNFKFLIASHSFLDSPHVHGKHLFTDFYEWLNFLGKISNKSKDEWYLKNHPYEANFENGFTVNKINDLLKKYPRIKLIPSDITHNQLVKEGINCVLTVVGSVGLEYAAMNVPVINASKNNPHMNFNFNIHAKSIKHYTELLLNTKKIKIKINKNEIYKYYFYKNIFYTRSWLFNDYPKMEKILKSQYNPEIYDYWIKNEFNLKKHRIILNNVRDYINSNDYKLGYKYIDRSIFEDFKDFKKKENFNF